MKYHLRVNCERERLSELRKFVQDVLEQHHVSDADTGMMVLAVDEVCANLMIHSHQCNPDEHISITVNVTKEGVTFEITDIGNSFNITEYKTPSVQEVIKSKKKGGIGIMLVRNIMDDIQFLSKNDHNVCRLFKRVSFATNGSRSNH